MKMRALALSVLAAALLVSPARSQDKEIPNDAQAEESAKKIKQLRTERIAVLKDVAEVSTRLAATTRMEVVEALADRMNLLEAELDAAEKESDRVALYRTALDSLKAYEEVAQSRKAAARGTEVPVLKVKARRLELEIRLEQARMKAAKEGG